MPAFLSLSPRSGHKNVIIANPLFNERFPNKISRLGSLHLKARFSPSSYAINNKISFNHDASLAARRRRSMKWCETENLEKWFSISTLSTKSFDSSLFSALFPLRLHQTKVSDVLINCESKLQAQQIILKRFNWLSFYNIVITKREGGVLGMGSEDWKWTKKRKSFG